MEKKYVMNYDEWLVEATKGFESLLNFENLGNMENGNGKIAIFEALDHINYMGLSESGFYKQIISSKLYEGFFSDDENFIDYLLLNEGVLDTIKSAMNTIGTVSKEMWDAAKNIPADMLKNIKELGEDIKMVVNWIIKKIKDGIVKIKDLFKSMITGNKDKAIADITAKLDKSEEKVNLLKTKGVEEGKGVVGIGRGFGNVAKKGLEVLANTGNKAPAATATPAPAATATPAPAATATPAPAATATPESIDNLMYLSVADYIKEYNMKAINDIKNWNTADSIYPLNEGEIPILSKLKEIVEKLPPFIFLTQIEEFLGKLGNEALTGLDAFLKSKGFGSLGLKYVVIGGLVATTISYILELTKLNPVVIALKGLLYSCGLSIIYHAMPWVFGTILTIMVIESFVPEAKELEAEAEGVGNMV